MTQPARHPGRLADLPAPGGALVLVIALGIAAFMVAIGAGFVELGGFVALLRVPVLLVPLLILSLIPLIPVLALLFDWLNRPGDEVCWSPLVVGEPAIFCFVAQGSRPHALWLSLDVHAPHSRNGIHIVLSTIQVLAGTRVIGRASVATRLSWTRKKGQHMGETLVVGVVDREKAGTEHQDALRQVRIRINIRPGGPNPHVQYRSLSKLSQLPPVPVGTEVTVHVLVHPTQHAHIRAHAFVALAR